jgi:hypothetical protein
MCGKRVFITQKKVIRIMAGAKKTEPCRGSVESFNMLLVASERILSFIVDNMGTFQTNSEISIRSARSKNDLHIHISNLTDYQKGVNCTGITLFNSLPYNILRFLGMM